MPRKKSYITVTDQFCGAGGSSQGVRRLSHRHGGGLEVKIAEALDSVRMLPAGFMAVPPRTCSPCVWDDVSRMHTLNSSQTKKKQEKHVCPLQFDIVDRALVRYSNECDTVYDPFGGIMTVPFRCIGMKFKGRPSPRYGIATELNENYWYDGVKYCREQEAKNNVPTLVDVVELENEEA